MTVLSSIEMPVGPMPIDSALLNKLHVRTPQQLKARATQLGGAEYLIEGLIPRQSLSLMVGDSGLGKSPLLYQAADSAHTIRLLGNHWKYNGITTSHTFFCFLRGRLLTEGL